MHCAIIGGKRKKSKHGSCVGCKSVHIEKLETGRGHSNRSHVPNFLERLAESIAENAQIITLRPSPPALRLGPSFSFS